MSFFTPDELIQMKREFARRARTDRVQRTIKESNSAASARDGESRRMTEELNNLERELALKRAKENNGAAPAPNGLEGFTISGAR